MTDVHANGEDDHRQSAEPATPAKSTKDTSDNDEKDGMFT